MNAIILSIGDELILGQTVDANSAWLSRKLAEIGCSVSAHGTVADDERAISAAIAEAAPRCDFLLITGGLGPTQDDLTRQALSGVLAQPLETNPDWLHRLEVFFRQRGRPMPETNRNQALIPRGARMIANSAGTAAGIDAQLTIGDPPHHCRIFAMPGVPREMQVMFESDVAPHIAHAGGGAVILSRTLHTFGLGESSIGEMLGDLMDRSRNPSVGTTVSGGVVSLRINARFPHRRQAAEELERISTQCRAILAELIYGQDCQTLSGAVGELLTQSHHQTVATAESCTGGLLAKMLTDVPGSSRYFQRGWITYSNESKTDLLGVAPDLIEKHGAVSEPVVLEMVQGAKERARTDFALSISGVAGPDGGTSAKPVGMVCIALATPTGIAARTFNFPGDREMIRDRAAKMALSLLRFHLLNKPVPF
jgi:nicotinamide-nucleotide amidase